MVNGTASLGSQAALPSVTVAICTWNRARLLAQTLKQLGELQVTRARWSVLVVDNRSTDNTAAVIKEYESLLPLRGILEPRPGLSQARNRALAEARTDFIVFTDDDVLVSHRWLDTLLEAAKSFPSGAAFGGPIDPWFVQAPEPAFTEAFDAVRTGFCGIDHQVPLGPLAPRKFVWGANMAFRTDAIAGLQFDPDLGPTHGGVRMGDEVDFLRRLVDRGGQIIWVPEMKVRHYVDPARCTLEYLGPYYVGRGRNYIRFNGADSSARILGAPRWMWRRYLESRFKYVLLRHYGKRRVSALAAFREAHFFKGMIQESQLLSRTSPDSTAAGAA